MSIVRWKQECIKFIPILPELNCPIPTSGKSEVILQPGWNEVHEGDWVNARKWVKDLIEQGLIEEKGTVIPATDSMPEKLAKTSFKMLKMDEALLTIEGTANLDTLKAWLANDTRDEIRMVLNKRIDLVQETQPNKEAPKKGKVNKLW